MGIGGGLEKLRVRAPWWNPYPHPPESQATFAKAQYTWGAGVCAGMVGCITELSKGPELMLGGSQVEQRPCLQSRESPPDHKPQEIANIERRVLLLHRPQDWPGV